MRRRRADLGGGTVAAPPAALGGAVVDSSSGVRSGATTPVWIRTSLLRKLLNSSPRDRNDNNVVGNREEWGWVCGFAAPQQAPSRRQTLESPVSPPPSGFCLPTQGPERARSRVSSDESETTPKSPFGQVKLRKMGSTASPRFSTGCNGEVSSSFPKSPSWAKPLQAPSLISTPAVPGSPSWAGPPKSPTLSSSSNKLFRGGRSEKSHDGEHEKDDEQLNGAFDSTSPLVVTISDPDVPHWSGRCVTIPAEDVSGGVLPANSCWPSDAIDSGEDPDGPPDDLINLTHLHEPAIVRCLRDRYARGIVYTRTGAILLACNPFRSCDGLYNEKMMRQYWRIGADESVTAAEKSECDDANGNHQLPPHVFAVADGAFRSMLRVFDEICSSVSDSDGQKGTAANQAILVSGESGAGKTVTTKVAMRYLAALSQQRSCCNRSAPGSSVSSSKGIEKQVLQSNPLLESFGNARTARNDNSSRFGKYIEMSFNSSGVLVGASIRTYLLEKVRLCRIADDERTYHVFYELLAGGKGGLKRTERKELRLDGLTAKDFRLTWSVSDTYDRRDGVQDIDTHREILEAMREVGFTSEERLDVFAVAAALLHLYNLSFVDTPIGESSNHGDGCSLDLLHPSLSHVLFLLGVDQHSLSEALTAVHITVAGEILRKSLNVEKAEKTLEGLVKATYGALFEFIVRRVNASITMERSGGLERACNQGGSISLLDIFGFESFPSGNSLEQLCINYCNEALQRQFNMHVFTLEQEEYDREGIWWRHIQFPDNQDVLDLIDKKHCGIFAVLDEQSRLAKCTDVSFAKAVYDKCGEHPRFGKCKSQRASYKFSVRHYAGSVTYDTQTSFLDKNRDDVPGEATRLLLRSRRPFLNLLGRILSEGFCTSSSSSTSSPSSKPFRRSASSLSRPTVTSQFTSDLHALRVRIDSASPHYVRCLKPNDDLQPNKFMPGVVADQLRCAGVLEAVRVARAGYPQRYSKEAFVERYWMLARRELDGRKKRALREKAHVFHGFSAGLRTSANEISGDNDICETLVRAVTPLVAARRQRWQRRLGEEHNENRGSRDAIACDPSTTGLQMGKTKVFLRQVAFDAMEQMRAETLDWAATAIQSLIRMHLSKEFYLVVLEVAVLFQSYTRRFLAAKKVNSLRRNRAAAKIQVVFRQYLAQRDYWLAIAVALWCQCRFRGSTARARYAHLLLARNACMIQSVWRMHTHRRRFVILKQLAIDLQLLARSKMARERALRLREEGHSEVFVVTETGALPAQKEEDDSRRRKELDDARRESLAEASRVLERARRYEEEKSHGPCSPSESTTRLSLSRPQTPMDCVSRGGSGNTPGWVFFRDFPSSPTAQEEHIRSLAEECAKKDRELELLRRQLESLQEEKKPSKLTLGEHSSEERGDYVKVQQHLPSSSQSRLAAATRVFFGGSPTSSDSPPVTLVDTDNMSTASSTLMSPSATPIQPRTRRETTPRRVPLSSLGGKLDAFLRRTGGRSSPSERPSPTSNKWPLRSHQSVVSPSLLDSEESDPTRPNSHLISEESQETAIHAAVREADEVGLAEAIDTCSNVSDIINRGDTRGITPLHLAARTSTLNLASLLVKHGAVANAQDCAGNTPLHFARNLEMAQLLVDAGRANLNIPNMEGICALHLAVTRKDVETVRFLVSRGADVNVADDIKWCTPLHLVSLSEPPLIYDEYQQKNDGQLGKNSSVACAQIAKILCDADPDLNYSDRDGNTPLHCAAILPDGESLELMSRFLRHGGDPNILNNRGQSPLHLMCHNAMLKRHDSFHERLDLVLFHGGDPNCPSSNGCTALHLALYHRDVDAAIQLLHRGAQLHLPWQKPARWEIFWKTTGLPDVMCLDMVTDEHSLHRILSSITVEQDEACSRPYCMRCKSAFGAFSRQQHCSHCGSLICSHCCSKKLGSTKFPPFCQRVHSGLRPPSACLSCEEILVSES